MNDSQKPGQICQRCSGYMGGTSFIPRIHEDVLWVHGSGIDILTTDEDDE